MSEIAGKRSVDARITRLLAVCAGAALLAAGCGGRAAPAPGMRVEWIVGRSAPGFDPDGPPDALRESLERLLSRGLTDEDTSGTVFPAAADSIAISGDRLTYTFRLPAELRFAGGQRCTAADFRVALEAGLTRTDHGTRAALLAAVRGMDAVRARRALPPLGIETPDSRTLVIRLARPDSLLLRKLSLPGVSTPWRRRAPGAWSAACGIGPFRVASSATDRWLVLVRDRRGRAADTLRVRFVPSAPRVRTLLRAGRIDLLWPPPGGLLAQPLPPGYHSTRSPARPARDLLLVMRADVPPTTHPPARQAIAHALHRGEVAGALEGEADAPRELIPGAAPFEFPKFDAVEVSAWLDRGHFGRSFHVTMAYDADGFSPVARALQGGWSRFNLYVELKPLRGAELAAEALGGQAQLLLIESQPPWGGAEAALQGLIMPLRGPAVGAFRSGWRTREFDAALAPRRGSPGIDPALAQARLEQELIALPLARLPWIRIEKDGAAAVAFHPHFGPDFAGRFAAPSRGSHRSGVRR